MGERAFVYKPSHFIDPTLANKQMAFDLQITKCHHNVMNYMCEDDTVLIWLKSDLSSNYHG